MPFLHVRDFRSGCRVAWLPRKQDSVPCPHHEDFSVRQMRIMPSVSGCRCYKGRRGGQRWRSAPQRSDFCKYSHAIWPKLFAVSLNKQKSGTSRQCVCVIYQRISFFKLLGWFWLNFCWRPALKFVWCIFLLLVQSSIYTVRGDILTSGISTMSFLKFNEWREVQLLLEYNEHSSVFILWRYMLWVPAKKIGILIQIIAILLRPSEQVLEVTHKVDQKIRFSCILYDATWRYVALGDASETCIW
jgi:hypothetical protein